MPSRSRLAPEPTGAGAGLSPTILVPRVEGSVHALPAILHALHEVDPPAGGVLSAFVDTSLPHSIGHASLLGFRARVKTIRQDLDDARRPAFEAAVAQAEDVIVRRYSPGHPGIAVFASGEETYLFAVPLPKPPPDVVVFGEQPVLVPLEAAIDDAERAVVLLFDKERARLFTIVLGEIEARHTLVDEVPGKQKTGGWFALSQTRYARHHEELVLRHAKRAIAALLAELERRPFDHLLMGGPDEAIALLEEHLPRRLRLRLAGTLSLELFASDADVLAATRPALEAIERRHEAEAVRKLLDDAGSPRVVLGPDTTLPALSDGRVHQLFILNRQLGAARACPACGRLTIGEGGCARCGTATEVVPDLRDRAVTLALQGGARVDLVSGEATNLLAPHGGIGARIRWAVIAEEDRNGADDHA